MSHMSVDTDRFMKGSANGGRYCTRKLAICNITILELDGLYEAMQISLEETKHLGHHLDHFSASEPTLSLLSPTVLLMRIVRKFALESYAKPDKVIMIDRNFLLDEHLNTSSFRSAGWCLLDD